ncbi:MAG: biotin/lipoyl-binding protein, partial [Rhodobacterales bacterium]|nr:biotin/lipoyl-binding protein [Rhodobacterales bacterium]
MVDIQIPQIGESITTVFIARWIKQAGEFIQEGESLLEIDSDKASMEVPSPTSGKVVEVLFEDGDEVAVGAVIARIDASATAAAPAAAPAISSVKQETTGEVRAGPAARQAASVVGVSLEKVAGTGPRGRITTSDVQTASQPAPAPVAKPCARPAPMVDTGVLVEREKMTPLRRTIARRLVEAQQTAAMLTTFNEVDMTRIMALRKSYQDRFVKKNGFKLGFMSFFVKAA